MNAPPLLLLMAMEAEARPVIEALDLHPLPAGALGPGLPFAAFAGEPDGRPVRLVTSGKDPRFGVDLIGAQPAVLHAYASVRACSPRAVLNAGTAGGFVARGARIGEVLAGSGPYLYHDRHIPIPGFDRHGVGSYPGADPAPLARALGLRTGVVATGNALDASPRDRAFFAEHQVDAKEMEAASHAWVCGLLGVPFYTLKAITDFVDHPADSAEQFLANLDLASRRLAETVVRAVPLLSDLTAQKAHSTEA